VLQTGGDLATEWQLFFWRWHALAADLALKTAYGFHP
jgi:hypothetical protein